MAITTETYVLTNVGRELLIDSIVNNSALNILKFKVGTGATSDADVTVTDLVNPVYEKDITSITKVSQNVQLFTCRLEAADGALGDINEVGIYSYDSSTSTYILFIYGTFPAITKYDTNTITFKIYMNW